MREIKELLQITQSLKEKYKRNFSLDGRLVGDIGEVLAAGKYGIKLYSENTLLYDGEEISTGRKVQIKSSFRNYCYFPFGEDKIPDYFLSVNILENGELQELFNGPGQFIVDHYITSRNLKAYKENYYSLWKGILLALNKQVPENEKIKEVVANDLFAK